jgi:hypothetical protein
MSAMRAPLGRLVPIASTADTETLVYRPRRRPVLGALQILAAVSLFAGAVVLGVRLSSLPGWLLAALPLLASAVLVARGLSDLISRSLFQLEIDRRARTLTLSALLDQGQALTKARFEDVQAVEVAPKDAAWLVSLPLRDGRRIALGCVAGREEADALAARFRETLA